MKSAKPTLEKISKNFGSSFTVRQFSQTRTSDEKFWHFHPEIELVYLPEGSGKRHIGNHLSYFTNGDLVLIGSNLPHSGFSDRLSGIKAETVIQVLPDFLGADFLNTPEMKSIQQLFDRARLGISFQGELKDLMGKEIIDLIDQDPFERLINLLSILHQLAISTDYQLLNVEHMVLEVDVQDNQRVNDIYRFVSEHFTRPIALEEIAKEVNLTVPSFSRYFKKLTGKTFTQFVNEYRIVHATKLLAEQPMSISEVSLESGFNNFSHFTKQFKAYTGKSPSQYRNELKQMVGASTGSD
ncbi:MAG: AraC family transcriptional regulator [Saprospiraceae bacterium]|nr:AraC family transcriptional regulator [Saprospiraceae bacterium]